MMEPSERLKIKKCVELHVENRKELVNLILQDRETIDEKLEALELISKNNLLPSGDYCEQMPSLFKNVIEKHEHEYEGYIERNQIIDFFTDIDYFTGSIVSERGAKDEAENEIFETVVNAAFEYVKENKIIRTKWDW